MSRRIVHRRARDVEAAPAPLAPTPDVGEVEDRPTLPANAVYVLGIRLPGNVALCVRVGPDGVVAEERRVPEGEIDATLTDMESRVVLPDSERPALTLATSAINRPLSLA